MQESSDIMNKFGTAVILCGGKSTRMGIDKQLIEFNDVRIIDIIHNKLSEMFNEVLIASNTPEYYDENYKVICDEIKNMGPLSGIHIGLKEASSEYVYFIACDMPNINEEYIDYIKNEILESTFDACITRYRNHIEPFNAFYNRSLINHIEEHLNNNNKSINSLLTSKKCLYISENKARNFSPDWNMFLNLNYIEDLDKFKIENKKDDYIKMIKKYSVKKIINEDEYDLEDNIIVEYPLTIFINNKEFITLLCSPKSLENLAIGFLESEGIINKKENINNIKIDVKNGMIYIDLNKTHKLAEKLMGKRTITSGCGKGTIFYNVIDSFKTKKINNNVKADKKIFCELMSEFNEKSEMFIKTGGVHSCALCNKNKILLFEEDIGRHNAVDKIFGKSLLENINLKEKILITSGRITSEIIIKAAKREIPIIVSRSAPTNLAIDIAKELNITLIGFARGKKLNMYTNFPSLTS